MKALRKLVRKMDILMNGKKFWYKNFGKWKRKHVISVYKNLGLFLMMSVNGTIMWSANREKVELSMMRLSQKLESAKIETSV